MTDRGILHRYSSRTGETAATGLPQPEDDSPEDCGAFGWLRGIRDRAISLELRKKDGSILAVNYGYMERAQFDPSDGITLFVSGQKVRIKGRNLNAEVRPTVKLFEGIVRHRVPWLRESDDGEQDENEKVVIDSLSW